MAASKKTPKTGRELFQAFLDLHDLKPADAAKALGVSKAAVSQWLHGDGKISEKSRQLIDTWTKGLVPRDSWGDFTDRRKAKSEVVPFEPPPKEENGSAA